MAVIQLGTPQRFNIGGIRGLDSGPTLPLVLVIMNPDQVRAPVQLSVSVSGAAPGATLTFEIDGEEIWVDVADADGLLDPTLILTQDDLASGTHTMTVTAGDPGDEGSQDFTLTEDAAAHPEDPDPDTDPPVVPGRNGRWVLNDVATGGLGEWIMPVSPQTMTNPHFDRIVSVKHTTAPVTGAWSVSEAEVGSKPWKIAGYYPDEDYLDQLKAYAELKHRFLIYDHRGRVWVVVLLDLDHEPRKRQSDAVSSNNDWAGSWSMDLMIVAGALFPEAP